MYALILLSFQRKMHALLMIGCFLLAASEYLLGSAHMIPDERLSTNRVVVTNALSQSLDMGSPPVVMVGKYGSLNLKLKQWKTKRIGHFICKGKVQNVYNL